MPAHIVAALDMGTAKVCSIVAEKNSGGVRILGVGTALATGIRKGMIVHIDETVRSIREAMDSAESASGTRIRSVIAGISGGHVHGFYSSGAVGVRGREVTKKDIQRAVDSAKTVYIPLDREVLHVIPTEFVLDGQGGISNPEGMSGIRLEARVFIVTGAVSAIQNLEKCCERAGLEVREMVVKGLASADAVLSADEKEYGIIVVDIGGGTTDIALFREKTLRHFSVLGIGGAHLTSDIAIGLRIGIHDAEHVKVSSGAAYRGMVQDSEEISIPLAGEQVRSMPRKYLVEVIQPRCEEMLEMIKKEIQACSGYESAPCGVVLTGGLSLLSGFDKLAETILGLPVRVGNPAGVYGMQQEEMTPAYATGIGLVIRGRNAEETGLSSHGAVMGMMRRCRDAVSDMSKYVSMITIQNRKEGGGIACLKSRK